MSLYWQNPVQMLNGLINRMVDILELLDSFYRGLQAYDLLPGSGSSLG